MLFEPVLVTYTNLPVGSTVTDVGFVPAAKGEPGTEVRAPVMGSIAKPMTVLTTPEFVTYRKFPVGSAAKEVGATPAVNGGPGRGMRKPVVVLIENPDMVPAPVAT